LKKNDLSFNLLKNNKVNINDELLNKIMKKLVKVSIERDIEYI
jgi:hypothetical protein